MAFLLEIYIFSRMFAVVLWFLFGLTSILGLQISAQGYCCLLSFYFRFISRDFYFKITPNTFLNWNTAYVLVPRRLWIQSFSYQLAFWDFSSSLFYVLLTQSWFYLHLKHVHKKSIKKCLLSIIHISIGRQIVFFLSRHIISSLLSARALIRIMYK